MSTGFGKYAILGKSPDQRIVGGKVRPLILQSTGECKTPAATAAFVKSHRASIDKALRDHGVVLFRDFPLRKAEDFDTFVCGFDGFQDLSYEESMSFAVRKRCSNRICTTNEGKDGGLVFHHEQAQTPLWPSRLFFCCLLPARPGDGGAYIVVFVCFHVHIEVVYFL